MFMKALITGASSGIGRDMALILGQKGYDLILVARREDRLNEIKESLKTNVKTIALDLSDEKSCYELFEITKNENIDILINNAGFGVFGEFISIPLDKELEMINLNIKALHILTKLFLPLFIEKDSGLILNVASSAAFLPGPLLAAYYASKAYVLRLSQAIGEELRKEKSKVKICTLCPGPVKTEFDKVAGVSFSLNGLTSKYVAGYALDKAFKGKSVIVPGFIMKLSRFFSKTMPDKILLKSAYNIQHKKTDK